MYLRFNLIMTVQRCSPGQFELRHFVHYFEGLAAKHDVTVQVRGSDDKNYSSMCTSVMF